MSEHEYIDGEREPGLQTYIRNATPAQPETRTSARAMRQHIIGARRFNAATAEPVRFVLGYNDLSKPPKQFATEAEADAVCHEWVTVEASSLDEAKSKYESAFDEWQRKNEEVT